MRLSKRRDHVLDQKPYLNQWISGYSEFRIENLLLLCTSLALIPLVLDYLCHLRRPLTCLSQLQDDILASRPRLESSCGSVRGLENEWLVGTEPFDRIFKL